MICAGLLSKLIFLVLRVKSGSSGNFPPPLTPERERECFRLFKYSNPQNQDDLISIGTIGLIKAVDSFDPKLGARFATYAGKCLQNEILMHFRSQKKLSAEVSLSETIDLDKDGNPLTWGDLIAVEDTIADDLDLRVRSEAALRVIRDELTPRERKIIVMRYGLSGDAGLTQRETAERLGISRSYVSRIEGAALKKLAERLGG